MTIYLFLHNRLADYIDVLCKQVQLDFMRSMNKITFDKIVRTMPEKFAYVEPQDPEPDIVPVTGKLLLLHLNFTLK